MMSDFGIDEINAMVSKGRAMRSACVNEWLLKQIKNVAFSLYDAWLDKRGVHEGGYVGIKNRDKSPNKAAS